MRRQEWGALAVVGAWAFAGGAAAADGAVPKAVSDASVYVPPLYDTFIPPAAGASYTDAVFGTSIQRLSEARDLPNNAGSGVLSFVSTEYPTASPVNSDGTLLILQHQSYFGIYAAHSGVFIRDLPLSVHAASEPRWSRTERRILYYVNGNALMKLDVVSQTSTLVRAFREYGAIRGRGESEISPDGDHFVFAADERDATPDNLNRFVFVYEVSSNTKGPVLDTKGRKYNQLYIASDNSVAIGWNRNGTARYTGLELFDRNMSFKRQLTHAIGHMHLTRDTNGDDVFVWNNSNDPLPIGCQNGIVKVRLANAQQTCLLQLDWSLALHVTAPDGNGWAFVATYAPADPLPAPPGWKVYTNEILQVKLDGSEVRRLLHHRSRPVNDYLYEPRPAISRDGTKLVFTSNYGLPGILGYAPEYADVYMVTVP